MIHFTRLPKPHEAARRLRADLADLGVTDVQAIPNPGLPARLVREIANRPRLVVDVEASTVVELPVREARVLTFPVSRVRSVVHPVGGFDGGDAA
jgi:hypothetical protein